MMSLTRKHFKAIAEIVKNWSFDVKYNHIKLTETETIERIKTRLADYFATENPNFDRQRFLKACM